MQNSPDANKLKAKLAAQMLADPTCQNLLPEIEQKNTNFAHQAKLCLPWYMMIGFVPYARRGFQKFPEAPKGTL